VLEGNRRITALKAIRDPAVLGASAPRIERLLSRYPDAVRPVEIRVMATLAANIAAGIASGPVGAVVAAWPAPALVISYELLMYLVRSGIPAAPAPAPEPPASLNGRAAEAAELFAEQLAAGPGAVHPRYPIRAVSRPGQGEPGTGLAAHPCVTRRVTRRAAVTAGAAEVRSNPLERQGSLAALTVRDVATRVLPRASLLAGRPARPAPPVQGADQSRG
jgi:hypothetical protein